MLLPRLADDFSRLARCLVCLPVRRPAVAVQGDAMLHLRVPGLCRRDVGHLATGLSGQLLGEGGLAAARTARDEDHLAHALQASTKCAAASGQPAKCRCR